MKRGILFLIFLFIFLITAGFFVKLTGLTFSGENTCDDSDNGLVYNEKGFVEGTEYDYVLRKIGFEYEDYCDDEKTLIEYHCVSNGRVNSYFESEKYKCEYKCLFGECINAEDDHNDECGIICRIKNFFT